MSSAHRFSIVGLGTLHLCLATNLPAQAPDAQRFVPLPAPTLIIGREDDPDHEFLGISAAHRLPNGEFAIADRLPAVRLFDAGGRLVRTLGREGAGPGEFRRVTGLFQAGDTLTVFDSNLQRLTRYLASGTLLGTQPLRISESVSVHVVGRLARGRWVLATPTQPTWNHGHGIYRDTLRVGTVGPSSTGAVSWLGVFRGATIFAHMPGKVRSRWAMRWAFFAPNSVLRTYQDTVVLGDTETADLQFFAADGRPVRRLTFPLSGVPDLTRLRAAARAEALAQSGPGTNREYVVGSYDAPRPTPRYRDLVAASDGQLWVRLFEEEPEGPSRYLVLSPAGAVRARVSLPAGNRVLTVQPNWILVVLRDADDVERLGAVRWAAP